MKRRVLNRQGFQTQIKGRLRGDGVNTTKQRGSYIEILSSITLCEWETIQGGHPLGIPRREGFHPSGLPKRGKGGSVLGIFYFLTCITKTQFYKTSG